MQSVEHSLRNIKRTNTKSHPHTLLQILYIFEHSLQLLRVPLCAVYFCHPSTKCMDFDIVPSIFLEATHLFTTNNHPRKAKLNHSLHLKLCYFLQETGHWSSSHRYPKVIRRLCHYPIHCISPLSLFINIASFAQTVYKGTVNSLRAGPKQYF